MKEFVYKDIERLSGLLKHDFLVIYARELQEHAQAIEQELYRSREERSKDGNRFYQSEAKQDRGENRNLYKQIGQLQGQLEAERIKHKAEIEVLQAKIKALQESQVVEVITEQEPAKVDHRKNRARDKKTGQLLPTGIDAAERDRMCYRLLEIEEKTPEEAAEILGGIGPESCVTYKNRYKRNRQKKLAEQAEQRRLAEQERAYYKNLENYGVYVDYKQGI